MAKRLISSENYVIPIMLAVVVELIVLVGLFFSWSRTPDIPPAKPTMVATLYELNSKSPTTKQSSEKFAGESETTKSKTTQETQLASSLEEQKKIADAKAKEAKRVAETKAKEAKKVAEAKAKEEAKKIADAKEETKKIAETKAKEAKKVADAKAKEEAKKIADAKAKEAKRIAEAKAKEESKKLLDAKAEAARKAKEAKEAAALADLIGDKVELGATAGDQLGSQVVGRIDDLIKQRVQENWTELGNPVPGTKVELLIEMSSNGTIINVSVSRSSGNVPFDNSAVTAVRNVGRIPEVQTLDTNTYNQLYRKRAFIFTAKGL